MQESSFSQLFLLLSLQISNHILKNLFSITASASPLAAITPSSSLSCVCVDLANSSQTYDCLFGTTCKEFHFFFLSYKFFVHFLSSPFSHTLSFFAFTQGKSYIKVVVKSLLLKICSPPTQQISFSTFKSSVQFC